MPRSSEQNITSEETRWNKTIVPLSAWEKSNVQIKCPTVKKTSQIECSD